MRSASLRVWLRWGVSALLALVSVFFCSADFRRQSWGKALTPGHMRDAWNYQAAFRLCIAMLKEESGVGIEFATRVRRLVLRRYTALGNSENGLPRSLGIH